MSTLLKDDSKSDIVDNGSDISKISCVFSELFYCLSACTSECSACTGPKVSECSACNAGYYLATSTCTGNENGYTS